MRTATTDPHGLARSSVSPTRRLIGEHRHHCVFCGARWVCSRSRHEVDIVRIGGRCCGECAEFHDVYLTLNGGRASAYDFSGVVAALDLRP